MYISGYLAGLAVDLLLHDRAVMDEDDKLCVDLSLVGVALEVVARNFGTRSTSATSLEDEGGQCAVGFAFPLEFVGGEQPSRRCFAVHPQRYAASRCCLSI